jgi:hypothetical protein
VAGGKPQKELSGILFDMSGFLCRVRIKGFFSEVFGQKRGNAGVFYRRAALSLFAGKSHLKKHPVRRNTGVLFMTVSGLYGEAETLFLM